MGGVCLEDVHPPSPVVRIFDTRFLQLLLQAVIITSRRRSCGKVMFPVACVIMNHVQWAVRIQLECFLVFLSSDIFYDNKTVKLPSILFILSLLSLLLSSHQPSPTPRPRSKSLY